MSNFWLINSDINFSYVVLSDAMIRISLITLSTIGVLLTPSSIGCFLRLPSFSFAASIFALPASISAFNASSCALYSSFEISYNAFKDHFFANGSNDSNGLFGASSPSSPPSSPPPSSPPSSPPPSSFFSSPPLASDAFLTPLSSSPIAFVYAAKSTLFPDTIICSISR